MTSHLPAGRPEPASTATGPVPGGARPPAVVHIINNLPVGGAERFLVLLAHAQARHGIRTEVVALTGPNPLAESLAARGVPFTALGARSLRDPRAATDLWRLLRERRPDAVHTHLFYADTFGRVAARAAGVPVVVSTEHSTERTQISAKRRWGMRLTAPLVQRVAAVSKAVAEAAVGRTPSLAGKVVVIPNGIELEPWMRAVPLPREGWRAGAGDFVIGCVGRLDAAKAQDVLVDAVAEAGDRRWIVVVAGDGPLREPLAARARDRGVESQFRWLGFHDDVPALLAAVDVYVQPSRYEGHSMALLEAMASGRACVVSDIPELVRTLDGTGAVVPAGDAPALAAALRRLQGDPELRARWGHAAQQAVQPNSIDASAAQYVALYREVAAERGCAWR